MKIQFFSVLCSALLLTQISAAKSNVPLNESALKDQLFNDTSRNHSPIGYNQARKDLLGNMAVYKDSGTYFVKDVYCESDYVSPGLGRIPNNSVINVEHTWPQSKFGGNYKRFQKSDLHHLYPTDSQLNSIRGNNPFGNVTKESQTTKCPQSKIGYERSGRIVFEPPQAHKGNVARALFYFSIRYKMPIDDVQEQTLKEWNIEDPVDEEELIRNDQVEQFQGNRNPFIDEPELALQISNF